MQTGERLGRTLSDDSYWLVHLNFTQTPSYFEGSVGLHITRERRLVFLDEQANIIHTEDLVISQITLPTLYFLNAANRDHCFSVVHKWLPIFNTNQPSVLAGDVINDFTDHLVRRVFGNVDSHESLTVRVKASLEHVSVRYEQIEWEQETIEDTDEENDQGLPEYWVDYLRDLDVFAVTEEEERSLDNCSICLDELVSNGQKGKKNLFRSPCKHVFHVECMAEWLRKSDSCPLCRFVVSGLF